MSITPLSPPPFIAHSSTTHSKRQPEGPLHESPPAPRDQAPHLPASNEKTNGTPDAEPSAEVQEKIDRITTLLDRNTLVQMMSAPNSRETTEKLKEFKELLSDKSLKNLTSNEEELAKLKQLIGQLLSEKNIHNLQREAAAGPNPEQLHHHLSNTDKDVPWRGAQHLQAEQRKEDVRIRQRSRLCDPLCKRLIAIGQPYQPLESETPPATTPIKPDKVAGADPEKPENTPATRPKTAQVQSTDTPRQPGEPHPTLKRIEELVSRESLINILRNPDSEQSVKRVEELTGLLNEASLNALTRDPTLQQKLKDRVRQVISKENLDTLRREEGIAETETSPNAGDIKPAQASKVADDAGEKIKRIGELISQQAIIRRLREPDSAITFRENKEIEELLSEDSLKTLADKPDELAELKKRIEQMASSNYLQTLQNELSHAVA